MINLLCSHYSHYPPLFLSLPLSSSLFLPPFPLSLPLSLSLPSPSPPSLPSLSPPSLPPLSPPYFSLSPPLSCSHSHTILYVFWCLRGGVSWTLPSSQVKRSQWPLTSGSWPFWVMWWMLQASPDVEVQTQISSRYQQFNLFIILVYLSECFWLTSCKGETEFVGFPIPFSSFSWRRIPCYYC